MSNIVTFVIMFSTSLFYHDYGVVFFIKYQFILLGQLTEVLSPIQFIKRFPFWGCICYSTIKLIF